MSMELIVDQLVGRKNIVDEENGRKLGEFGYLSDVAVVTGNRVRQNKSGMLTGVRIVKNGHATESFAPGLGVRFKAFSFGTEIDALPADGAQCDGVIDPSLTSDVAPGETFLLFVEGPANVTVNGAIAGTHILSAGGGKFKTATSTTALRAGRLLEDASGLSADDKVRVYLDMNSGI